MEHRSDDKRPEAWEALKATPSRKWAECNDAATPEWAPWLTANTHLGCSINTDLKEHLTAAWSIKDETSLKPSGPVWDLCKKDPSWPCSYQEENFWAAEQEQGVLSSSSGSHQRVSWAKWYQALIMLSGRSRAWLSLSQNASPGDGTRAPDRTASGTGAPKVNKDLTASLKERSLSEGCDQSWGEQDHEREEPEYNPCDLQSCNHDPIHESQELQQQQWLWP